jgi:4-amino-4-deoxy-L-arabinose transferase-like glycosyltransferase
MLKRPWVHRILIAGVFFAIIGPTLSLLDFTGGMEDYNVATAAETVRDGHWAIPTLSLQPRLVKPPIVHWITALGLMSSPRHLAWGARWPSLAVASLGLVAIYDLCRLLVDVPTGLIGACVGGTNVLFLKFAGQASYDINFATWVTWTNVFLAAAITARRRWALPAAGLCLGLAIMCKGPVAILQTVVPLGVFLVIEKRPRPSGSILLAAAVCLAVALPWPIYVLTHLGGGRPSAAIRIWYNEVVLEPETEHRGWHTYFVVSLMMTPWVVWFFWGMIDVAKNWRQNLPGLRLALLWLFIPVAVMEFFPARRDRYLLPMIGPAALLAAYGLLRQLPRWNSGTRLQRWLVLLHGVVVAALGIGLPILGLVWLTTADGRHWYAPAGAAAAVVAALAILAVGLPLYRRNRIGLVAGTAAMMFLAYVVFMRGYRDSSSGRSEGKLLAGDILKAYPDAQVFNAAPRSRTMLPTEVLIYLNRDVPALSDPSSLRPSDRTQVLIYQTAGRPGAGASPPAPPPGFEFFVRHKINAADYDVFVRPKV